MAVIKYSCFANPPYGINISIEYAFGRDAKGYFYAKGENKNYLPIEEIKMLFSPVEGDWESVLSKKIENKTEK